MEIEVNGKIYKLKASIKFLETVEPLKVIETDSGKVEFGLVNLVVKIRDTGDVLALRDLIFYLNEGQSPRLTKDTVDALLDDEKTDVGALAQEVLDFLYEASVSRLRLKALGMLPQKEESEKQ